MQGKVKYQEATGKVGGRKSMAKSQRKQTKKNVRTEKKQTEAEQSGPKEKLQQLRKITNLN